MIERFNFYDLYGYLIPGIVLWLLLCLPFGMVNGTWPSSELASAIVSLVVSYLTGLFLHSWISDAYPHTKQGRPPSTVILDEDNEALSSKQKSRLLDRIRSEFDIDVLPRENDNVSSLVLDDRRQDAFYRCRQRVVAAGRAGYAEQFQGLFAMTRGVMAASAIGSWYVLGLLAGSFPWWPRVAGGVVLVTLGAATLLQMWRPKRPVRDDGGPRESPDAPATAVPIKATRAAIDEERHALVNRLDLEQRHRHARLACRLFAGLTFFGGAALSVNLSLTVSLRYQFLAIAAGLWFVYFQAQLSYVGFAEEFAKAVYRAFVTLPESGKEHQRQQQPVTSGN